MAFRRKADSSGDIFKFENVGDSLTGFYLGTFDHDGEYGPTKKHAFKTKKGVKVVIGQTHLTQLLTEGESVVGKLVEVTYASDKKVKKGNPMKMYELGIDDSVEALDSAELSTSSEDAEDSGEDEEQHEDDTPAEEEEEEKPADEVKTAPARSIAATKPSAASKAKVDAILNKRKNVA